MSAGTGEVLMMDTRIEHAPPGPYEVPTWIWIGGVPWSGIVCRLAADTAGGHTAAEPGAGEVA